MSKQQLQELLHQRKTLEDEIAKIKLSLNQYSNTFDKGLIDEEGFPRADLDFAQLSLYRNLKRSFNEKNNDHAALMKLIEKQLSVYHSEIQNDPNVQKEIEEYEAKHKVTEEQIQQIKTQANANPADDQEVKPFALITEVSENSPASLAGLKEKDFIVQLGSLNVTNAKSLQDVAQLIKAQIYKPIKISVARLILAGSVENVDWSKESYLIEHLELVPREWAGQGILGCRFKLL